MCGVAPKTLDDEDDEDAGDLDYDSQPVIASMIYQNLDNLYGAQVFKDWIGISPEDQGDCKQSQRGGNLRNAHGRSMLFKKCSRGEWLGSNLRARPRHVATASVSCVTL
ncbi:hypothetical protein ACFX13_032300 [Malus domestica]